jgi:hypothetical protein
VVAFESRTAIPQVYNIIKSHFDALEHWVELAIREGVDLGQVRSGTDPHLAAESIIVIARGFGFRWFLDPSIDVISSQSVVWVYAQTLRAS